MRHSIRPCEMAGAAKPDVAAPANPIAAAPLMNARRLMVIPPSAVDGLCCGDERRNANPTRPPRAVGDAHRHMKLVQLEACGGRWQKETFGTVETGRKRHRRNPGGEGCLKRCFLSRFNAFR